MVRSLCQMHDECTGMFYWSHYLHHGMVYVRWLYLIYLWIYTHMLLITQPTPCCMSDHFNSNCKFTRVLNNPQQSSILKYWNITQHITPISVIWRHCKHIVIAITIHDSLMHCRISMKPCPESINEKKIFVLIMNEVDVGVFFNLFRGYQLASEEYDQFS